MKRIISFILLCAFVLSVVPANVFAAESEKEYSISNAYLTYSINNKTGGFSIETIEGHPQKKYDNNMPLLYKEDKGRSNGTSFTTVRIGDKDYIFGQEYGFFGLASKLHEPVVSEEGRLLTVQWDILDYSVVQKVALSMDDENDLTGNVGISYEITNNGSNNKPVGVRVLLDTALGNEIDAPYVMVDDKLSPLYMERSFEGADVPGQIRLVDSLASPQKMAYALIKGFNNGAEPNRVVAGHWANMANTRYEYTADEYCDFTNYSNKYSIPDSALSFYWTEENLASGTKRTCEMLYGMGNFSKQDEESNVGIDVIVDEVKLNAAKDGYENDGLINVTVNIDNSLDSSLPLSSALIALTCDEGLTIQNNKSNEAYAVINVGEVKTCSFALKAENQSSVTSKAVYISLTADETGEDGNVRTVNSSVQRFVLLPRIDGDLPDIQMNTINPQYVYTDGEKNITVSGKMKEFEALSGTDGWKMYLVQEGTNNEYFIPKKNISFIDDKYTQMSFKADKSMSIGKYNVEFRFTDTDLIDGFGTTKIRSQASFTVSADEKYKQASYGILALVRYDTTNYKYITFANEAQYQKFYKGELAAGGITHDFRDDIVRNEIMLVIRGYVTEMKKDGGQIYYQAYSSDSPITINNMLTYDSDNPLVMDEDGGKLTVSGDGMLRVINSISVWKYKWSFSFNNGTALTLDDERSHVETQLELSLDSAAMMIQSIGGFLIDLKYGVMSSDLQDNGDTTYGISFGGSISIPIPGKKSEEQSQDQAQNPDDGQNPDAEQNPPAHDDNDDDYSDSIHDLFGEDDDDYSDAIHNMFGESDSTTPPSGGSSGDSSGGESGGTSGTPTGGQAGNASGTFDRKKMVEKDTVFSDGGLSAEIEQILYGQKNMQESGEYETGFIGIDTTVELGLPENAFGGFITNPPIRCTFKINTIENVYELDFGLKIKIIECEGILGFKEVQVNNKDMVLPDKLQFYIRDGLKVPIAPPLFMTGIGGGIEELADSFADNRDGIPPVTVLIYMRLALLETMTGDFNGEFSGEGLKITGDMTFQKLGATTGGTSDNSVGKKVFDLEVGISARWVDPWAVNLYGKVSIIDGLIKGTISITFGDDTFYGYVYAAVCIPDDIPIIGGKELAGVEFAVSNDFIGGNIKIIGISFGIIYYWESGDYDYGTDVDLSQKFKLMGAPIFGEAKEEPKYEAVYGSNIKKIETQDVKQSGFRLMSSGKTISKSFNSAQDDAILFEIPYTGYVLPTVDDFTLTNPEHNEIELIPDDGNGGGNFMIQDRGADGKYIYISVTDKNMLKDGVWTVEISNNAISANDFGVYSADSLAELSTASYTYTAPYGLDVAWTTTKEVNEDATINVYLTEDKDVLEKAKTSKSGLDSNFGVLIGTKELSKIANGSAHFDLSESFANGKYYVVTTLSSKSSGISTKISNNAFDFVNNKLPKAAKSATLSYGGNGVLNVEVQNADDYDYNYYIATLEAIDGTVVQNAFTQAELGTNPIRNETNQITGERFSIGVQSNLIPQKEYKVKVTTLREENGKFFYGPTIETNSYTLDTPNKPKLLSVTTNISDEGILTSDIMEIKYIFDQDVRMNLRANTKEISGGNEYKKEWNWKRRVNDGEYIIDFIAYGKSKDFVKGSDFENVPNSTIGLTVDTEPPILSLAQISTASMSDTGENVTLGANVIVASDDGAYTINAITEANADIYVDDVRSDIKVGTSGEFAVLGKLAKDEYSKKVVLKAVDKVGNSSELSVYILPNTQSNVTGIDIQSDGNPTESHTMTAKPGDVIPVTVLGQFTDSARTIDNSEISWQLLRDKGVMSFVDGNLYMLAPGESGLSATYITAVTAENQSIGPNDYVLIDIKENDKNDLKSAIDAANKALAENKRDAEKTSVLSELIKNAQEIYDDTLSTSAQISQITTDLKNGTTIYLQNDNPGTGTGGRSSGTRTNKQHKVSVRQTENGNVTVSSNSVISGTSLTITATPDEGYRINEILVNGVSYGNQAVTTIASVNEDLDISVTFKEKWVIPFSDVSENDWFLDAVEFVYESGIAKGISETEFAPHQNVTRGQFITMLCRAYEIPEMTGDNFADAGNTWYTGYLAAAKQLGISNGVGNNNFAPEAEITREEMVTLIYNYMKYAKKVTEETSETLFVDNADISDWAKKGVAYAAKNGIVKGKGDNRFAPLDKATRGELAQIFYNIFNK